MMKKWLAFLVAAATVAAQAQVWVDGYTRRDGTYVEGHHRSAPNSQRYDNYNSQSTGTNPYTGRRGYGRDEFSMPSPQYNQSSPAYGSSSSRRCSRDVWGNVQCD